MTLFPTTSATSGEAVILQTRMVRRFSNGQNQNIFALYNIFQSLGHETLLVAEKHALEDENIAVNKKVLLDNYEVCSMKEVMDQDIKCDLFIQAAITWGEDWIKILRNRNPSIKIIQVNYGPRLFIDLEFCINGSNGGGMGRQRSVDEVWTSPHYDYSIDY